MADINLKTEVPDTTLPSTGFLFGADSQSAASPSVYSTQAVATALLGSTSLTGATVTADSPVLNLAQTWNNSGVTFTGLKFNVPTDSSAAGSLLMDLQVGGNSRFAVRKSGQLSLLAGTKTVPNTDNVFFATNQMSVASSSAERIRVDGLNGIIKMHANFSIAWQNSTAGFSVDVGTDDLFLTRRAAANLRLGAADAAGSAIAINSVASNQLTLASNHGLTTGAAIIITGSVAPSGTSLNTRYYARVIAAAVIELYSTYDQATAASGTTGIIAVTTAGTSASVRLATPFQSFGVQDFTGTDIPGQPFIIRGSRGTGTGPGGDIIFQVAPAGTTGSVQNGLTEALRIGSNRAIFANQWQGLDNTQTYIRHDYNSLYILGCASPAAVLTAGPSGWTFSDVPVSINGAILRGDAANTLALRNGANAQAFNIYNTTDGTNAEWAKCYWASNKFIINTQASGTGTSSRVIELQCGGGAKLNVNSGDVTVTGALLMAPDNTYDIGTSNANRPRSIYAGTSIEVNGYFQASDTGSFFFQNRSVIKSAANGDFTISNRNQTDFGRLNFGGTTSSFPALKRSSTTLQARLADDSAFAPVQGKLTTDTAYAAGDPTTTGYLVVYDSTGAAFKIPAVAV